MRARSLQRSSRRIALRDEFVFARTVGSPVEAVKTRPHPDILLSTPLDLEGSDACVFSGRGDYCWGVERDTRALLRMARHAEKGKQEGRDARSVPDIFELVHCEFLSGANTLPFRYADGAPIADR
jgi:hypothetical protein